MALPAPEQFSQVLPTMDIPPSLPSLSKERSSSSRRSSPERVATLILQEKPIHARQIPKKPATVENRLRPAADVINRIIWDPDYDSDDFVIVYEDRFEGRLEASFNTWKRETTHDEFIPQHRILHIKRRTMTPRRRRFEFSFRKRHSGPSTSSSSISPTIPVLQSPMAFQALGARTISEATLKQKNKLDRAPVRPSMFLEEKDDDEHPMYPIKPGAPADVKPTHLERKSIEGESVLRPKSQYFEEMFNIRGLVTSPRTQITHESVTVVEVKINTRVKDDDTLASTISSKMAQILEKPEVFIMTTIQQDACVYFGNSNTPAYLMKVFALPVLIAPIMNLRSTILIQIELQKILSIAPNRGIILYIPMPEENLATNGMTVMGQLANLERGTGIFRTISRTVSRKLKSGSTQSAPISVATTSSWNFSDKKSPASMTENQSHESEASKEGKKFKFKSRSRSTTKARSSLSSAVREDADQPEPVDNVHDRSHLYIPTIQLRDMEPEYGQGRILEIEGNLFDAPDGAALIQSCNCQGAWGKGIAKQFRDKYPNAYFAYRTHCQDYNALNTEVVVTGETGPRRVRLPEGTALVIPPQHGDYEPSGGHQHWIICLFTSFSYGTATSPVDILLGNTELAVADLKKQLEELRAEGIDLGRLWSCRFNSGLFGVDWAHSRDILVRSGLEVTVVSPPRA
ncbi:hypothetical protein BO86DRAFT_435383 [Aspergillus japonicus CBS 114.51]|uniref:MJ1316 RNA cyclic group end recognition domain-containing protein n=1 Tax=Aspergillus japonicus CBS 114.51 TaxID=1448312 RepID=A0A8T8WVG7_ASPJA|nr:hypothetical protein BO86DRAFT_435383 [Aspergillus japonicus CBS 114.51]RAH79848.1 hypothetical protein BO86DRAFT_435383 [Aspergillus japonicus CBS 114.51]